MRVELGSTVRTSDGKDIGRIDKLVLDPDTGQVKSVVVRKGVILHDDVEIPGPTSGALGEQEVERGPLVLQDHGNPVRYRNVWIAPR